MWQLVKSELEYYKRNLLLVAFFILAYAIFAITDFRLVSDTFLEKGSWGIYFMVIMFFTFYSIWLVRMNEKRTRMFALLPVKIDKIAMSRFILIQTIVISLLVCLLFITLLSGPPWIDDTDDILFQLGAVLIIFSIIVGAIDVWFVFRDNPFVRLLGAVIFLIATGVPTIIVFIYLRPVFYDLLGVVPGKILYLLWGSVLLFISTKIYTKRKYFLLWG